MTQVGHLKWQAHGFTNLLHWLALSDGKMGAEDFVAVCNLIATVPQNCYIQRTANPKTDRNVIKVACRLELMQKPKALLGKRERQVVRASQRTNLSRGSSLIS